MDLFGKKAQARYEAERAFNKHVMEKANQAITLLQEARADRDEAVKYAHILEVEKARLEERLAPFQASASPQRLYMTEDEEEARFAFEQGHITREELEKQLRKAGFDNAVVELAPEVSDIVY